MDTKSYIRAGRVSELALPEWTKKSFPPKLPEPPDAPLPISREYRKPRFIGIDLGSKPEFTFYDEAGIIPKSLWDAIPRHGKINNKCSKCGSNL